MDGLRKVFSRESVSVNSNDKVIIDSDVPVDTYKKSPVAEIQRMRQKAEHLRTQRDDEWNQRAWQGDRPPPPESNNSKEARLAQQKLIKDIYKRPPRSDAPSVDSSAVRATLQKSTSTSTSVDSSNLVLHDLCGEATTVDDIAWMNALYCLSQQPHLASVIDEGWTPLHVCCMGQPPKFIIKGLLCAFAKAARIKDDAGRLPIHFCAASSADPEILQMLVDEYPAGLSQVDDLGLTPLHLLLRNTDVPITIDNTRILLGDTLPDRDARDNGKRRVSLRRKEHLNLSLEELDVLAHHKKPASPIDTSLQDIEDNYPQDIQQMLKKIHTWGKRNKSSFEQQDVNPDMDISPAAIPQESSIELPVHMVVRRLIVEKSGPDGLDALHQSFDGMWDSAPQPSLPGHFYQILRNFVAAYPASLTERDAFGLTPLLVALLDRERVPDLDVIEVLLGRRSASHVDLPEWAHDLPYNRISARFQNPAMVPNQDTGCLPLHIAAEEFLDHHALIASIVAEYPGAIHAQDNQGKTPLHHALHNYRKIPIDPVILSLLSSNEAVKIRDDTGKLPLDYLLEGAHTLPATAPRSKSLDTTHGEESSTRIYRDFFGASLSVYQDFGDSDSASLIRKLRALPPWLRAPACGSGFVRNLILEELSKAHVCFVILLDGVLLLALTIIFCLQMEQFYDRVQSGVDIDSWYTGAIYGIAAIRLVFRIVQMTTSTSFGEFIELYFANLPFWIDCASNVMTIVVSVSLNGVGSDETFPELGSATIALLWLTILTYLSMTFQGMSVYMGALLKVLCAFIWPFFLAIAFLTGFAQLFFTLLQYDCVIGSESGISVCGARDAYRLVYLLLRGESLVDMSGATLLSDDVILLITFFLAFGIVVLLGALMSVLYSTLQMDWDEIANVRFWQQRLSFILSFNDWGPRPGVSTPDKLKLSRSVAFWNDRLMGPSNGGEQSFGNMCFSFVKIILFPIRVLLGICSLGLWLPREVRKSIFCPSGVHASEFSRQHAANESLARSVAAMREDISRLKVMTYEKSGEVESELQELHELLVYALKGQ